MAVSTQSGNDTPTLRAADAKKIVVPRHPFFDKCVAIFLVAMRMGMRRDIRGINLEFRLDQHPTRQSWQRWEKEHAYVIDVGRQKYQILNRGSSARIIAEREEMLDKTLVRELIELADRNNETGNLKGYSCSLVHLLRLAYGLGYDRKDVVARVCDAIEARLMSQICMANGRFPERTKETFSEQLKECEALRQLLDQTGGRDYRDFTVCRLALDLWRTNHSLESITAAVEYWLTVKEKDRESREKLDLSYSMAERREFANGRGLLIRTSVEQLGRHILNSIANKKGRHFNMVVVRRVDSDPRQRNISILTRGGAQLNLENLAGAVYLLEGHSHPNQEFGRWYLAPGGCLLNGGISHRVPATFLRDPDLIGLIELAVFGQTRGTNIPALVERLIQSVDERFRAPIDRDTLTRWLNGTFPNNLKKIVLDGRWEKR